MGPVVIASVLHSLRFRADGRKWASLPPIQSGQPKPPHPVPEPAAYATRRACGGHDALRRGGTD